MVLSVMKLIECKWSVDDSGENGSVWCFPRNKLIDGIRHGLKLTLIGIHSDFPS